MESAGEKIPFQEYASCSDFGIVDFMDNESNLDQFIIAIGEEIEAPIVDFTSQVFDEHLLSSGHNQLFDFDVAGISPDCSEFPNGEEEREEEEEESSATTTNASEQSKKSDRSTTLISERRRRGRMKEKLFALRALVPNITKMDKASIIGDAVLYVQDLQMQAKKLKSEIAGLESSFPKPDKIKLKSKKINAASLCPNPIIKKIFKIDAFEVEEREFYARIVCQKGKGVAVFLYKALHSLPRVNVRSSNLVTDVENYVLTFTLHVAEKGDMDLSSLKMWVARAFLGQGFEFEIFNSV